MNQELDKLAKEIFLLAPQGPFDEESWDELPMDDEIKEVIYKIARHVAIMVLEARISQTKYLFDKNPVCEDVLNDLQRQKSELEKI